MNTQVLVSFPASLPLRLWIPNLSHIHFTTYPKGNCSSEEAWILSLWGVESMNRGPATIDKGFKDGNSSNNSVKNYSHFKITCIIKYMKTMIKKRNNYISRSFLKSSWIIYGWYPSAPLFLSLYNPNFVISRRCFRKAKAHLK